MEGEEGEQVQAAEAALGVPSPSREEESTSVERDAADSSQGTPTMVRKRRHRRQQSSSAFSDSSMTLPDTPMRTDTEGASELGLAHETQSRRSTLTDEQVSEPSTSVQVPSRRSSVIESAQRKSITVETPLEAAIRQLNELDESQAGQEPAVDAPPTDVEEITSTSTVVVGETTSANTEPVEESNNTELGEGTTSTNIEPDEESNNTELGEGTTSTNTEPVEESNNTEPGEGTTSANEEATPTNIELVEDTAPTSIQPVEERTPSSPPASTETASRRSSLIGLITRSRSSSQTQSSATSSQEATENTQEARRSISEGRRLSAGALPPRPSRSPTPRRDSVATDSPKQRSSILSFSRRSSNAQQQLEATEDTSAPKSPSRRISTDDARRLSVIETIAIGDALRGGGAGSSRRQSIQEETPIEPDVTERSPSRRQSVQQSSDIVVEEITQTASRRASLMVNQETTQETQSVSRRASVITEQVPETDTPAPQPKTAPHEEKSIIQNDQRQPYASSTELSSSRRASSLVEEGELAKQPSDSDSGLHVGTPLSRRASLSVSSVDESENHSAEATVSPSSRRKSSIFSIARRLSNADQSQSSSTQNDQTSHENFVVVPGDSIDPSAVPQEDFDLQNPLIATSEEKPTPSPSRRTSRLSSVLGLGRRKSSVSEQPPIEQEYVLDPREVTGDDATRTPSPPPVESDELDQATSRRSSVTTSILGLSNSRRASTTQHLAETASSRRASMHNTTTTTNSASRRPSVAAELPNNNLSAPESIAVENETQDFLQEAQPFESTGEQYDAIAEAIVLAAATASAVSHQEMEDQRLQAEEDDQVSELPPPQSASVNLDSEETDHLEQSMQQWGFSSSQQKPSASSMMSTEEVLARHEQQALLQKLQNINSKTTELSSLDAELGKVQNEKAVICTSTRDALAKAEQEQTDIDRQIQALLQRQSELKEQSQTLGQTLQEQEAEESKAAEERGYIQRAIEQANIEKQETISAYEALRAKYPEKIKPAKAALASESVMSGRLRRVTFPIPSASGPVAPPLALRGLFQLKKDTNSLDNVGKMKNTRQLFMSPIGKQPPRAVIVSKTNNTQAS